jgi:hypothetical protein
MHNYTLNDVEKSLAILENQIELIKTEIDVTTKSFINDSKVFGAAAAFLAPLINLYIKKTYDFNGYNRSNGDLSHIYKRIAQRSLALARIQETVEQMEVVMNQLKKGQEIERYT